jgi:mannose-6-phosphate isomerase-like protein (cupin superfamily)
MDRRSFLSTTTFAALATAIETIAQIETHAREPFIVETNHSRDGYPDVTPVTGVGRITCKLRSSDTGGRLAIMENVSPQYAGPPLHSHDDVDEWFYVAEGEFLFEIGGKLHHVGAGASLFGPMKIPHRFMITSKTPGRLLVAFQPGAHMEDFFVEMTNFRNAHSDATPTQLKAIWTKYHMQLLGEPLPPPTAVS